MRKDIIKSDDPKALEKYKERLEKLETQIEETKKTEHTKEELNYLTAKASTTRRKIKDIEAKNQ